MKLKIKAVETLTPGRFYWQVNFNGNTTAYCEYKAAEEAARKLLTRYFKESGAFAMVNNIAINMLSMRDADFITKMVKCKCKGITVKQYGFIKGIHERQQAAW